MRILILFFALAFQTAWSGEISELDGDWEGFFTGSYKALGYIRVNFGKKPCAIKLKQLDTSDYIEFPCESLRYKEGLFTFTTAKKFPGGNGWVETKYQMAIQPHMAGSSIPRKISGSWIQGMKESEGSSIVGLNSAFFRLREIKKESLFEK